ncbi:hypothetical protein FPV67DRAFT_1491259 [Lyophyllum atratum]|nr:hypothetical protein FPV67DRAFT_1491259 [Lyophyllum atratum]
MTIFPAFLLECLSYTVTTKAAQPILQRTRSLDEVLPADAAPSTNITQFVRRPPDNPDYDVRRCAGILVVAQCFFFVIRTVCSSDEGLEGLRYDPGRQ